MKNLPVTIIKSKSNLWKLNLDEVWKYRDLIILFVKRDFKIQYKQTILGPLWLILNPLMTSVVFTVVFGNFANLSTDGVPHILFYMAGNTMWIVFSSILIATSNTFTANAGIFGKVYFPRLCIPISTAITALVNFVIQFAMFLIFFTYFIYTKQISISLNIIFIPIFVLNTCILALGTGLIISSITTKYRDLAIAVGFGVQLWMYATPIVYPLNQLSSFAQKIILINPMTSIINNYRYILLNSGEFFLLPWIYSIILSIIILIFGIMLFNKTQKTFMDTV